MNSIKHFLAIVLILAIAVLPQLVFAEKTDNHDITNPPVINGSGGPDLFGYTWIDSDEPGGPEFGWIDISTVGVQVPLGDDQNLGPFDIGFDFSFYGVDFSTVRICSNGFVSFTSTSASLSNVSIPNANQPNNLLSIFWDDLNPSAAGAVYYYSDTENDRFIVSYDGVPHYSNNGALYFQLIMNQNGSILMQYASMYDAGHGNNSATIGIENGDGTDGLLVVYNANYIHDNMAIYYSAEPPFDYDVGPVDFVSPSGMGQAGEPFTPIVTFENFGAQAASFDVNLDISLDGQSVYDQTGNISDLAPGTDSDYQFPDYTPDVEGTYVLTATSLLGNDENTENDALVLQFEVLPEFLPPTGLTATSYQNGVVPLEWFEPGIPPCELLYYDDGVLANAFYYYAADNLIAQAFVATAPTQVCTAYVHVLTQGDQYWPWPDGNHDPIQVKIWDDAGNGTPGDLLADVTATAQLGQDIAVAFDPPIDVTTNMFWVSFNNISDTGPYDGLGLDAVSDYPQYHWVREGGVWQNVSLYDGDRMIRASVRSMGRNLLLNGNNPTIDDPVILDTQELTGYNVYRDTEPDVPVSDDYRIAQGVVDTEYDDIDVVNGTTYYYVVTAVYDSDGEIVESSPSNEASAMPAAGGQLAAVPDEITYNAVPGEVYTTQLNLVNNGDLDVDFNILATTTDRLFVEREIPYNPNTIEAKSSISNIENQNKFEVDDYNPPVITGSGGPDIFGYSWIDSDEPDGPTFEWVDISGIGIVVPLSDDDNEGPFDMGFGFPYYGNVFNSLYICSNGFVSFTSTSSSLSNTYIPNPNEPNNLLAVFWDDINPNNGGTVYYYYDEDNGRFIVSYDGVPHYSNYGSLFFQVILYQNGTIVYQYASMDDGGHGNNGATIGIENGLGDDGLEVVYNADYVHDNLAIRFKTGWLSATPLTGVVPAGDQFVVDVIMDATDLEPILYEGQLYITASDINGDLPAITVPVHLDLFTGIEDGVTELPDKYGLSQNYPNPFNATTSIEFALPEPAFVELSVYNMLGQKVATLTSEMMPAGYHSVNWDASNAASGMYFYKLVAGDYSEIQSMTLLK